MTTYNIDTDNIIEWAKTYNGEQFHALICDPPYELGFMGKDWDNSGVAFQPETWRLICQHLLPGGFGMAFASSRGWHRLAVAIEDAGMIIHPSVFLWGFGSGFPKATRIDTQVDKAAGKFEEREVVGVAADFARDGSKRNSNNHKDTRKVTGFAGDKNHGWDREITQPATPLAQQWEGHRYGLQAMKPAVEPIIVFQKPYGGKPVEVITETGAGALWIDGGRIGTDIITNHGAKNPDTFFKGKKSRERGFNGCWVGRWPANLVLSHSPDCGDDGCVDSCAVGRLGEQETARYFFNATWSLDIAEQIATADTLVYQAKAGRKERDAGLEGLEFEQAHNLSSNSCGNCGLRVKANGSGEKCTCGENRITIKVGRKGNPHPTVKPITLIKHLATILLPPDTYAPRRILVPFSGSGSEMIGALLAGWDYVHGVELSQEYANIALARLQHWVHWAGTETTPQAEEGKQMVKVARQLNLL